MKKWKYSIILTILSILLIVPFSSAFAEESLSWERKTNMPEARAVSGVAVVDGIIYVIGGSSGSMPYKDVQAYNPTNNSWSKKADMPTARSSATTIVHNGKIYVMGGYTGNYFTWTGGVTVDTVEVYDPKTDTWSTKAKMPVSVGTSAGVMYNNKIYLFGGLTTSVRSVATVQVYDPASDTWTTKKDMTQPIHNSGAVTINNKIYLLGGRYIGPNQSQNQFLEYDPTSDSWVTKPSLPELRNGPAAVVYENKIIAIGGSTPDSESKTVVAYDFTTNAWQSFASLNEARSGATAVIYGGKIYVVGGSSSFPANAAVGSVEVYGKDSESENPGPIDPTNPEQPETGDRAILVVTMTTGLEKEFDLSMTEVNAFIDWYEAKSNGIGSAKFAIDKHGNNKGPFSSRKDYVIFDKILTFEVNEYTKK